MSNLVKEIQEAFASLNAQGGGVRPLHLSLPSEYPAFAVWFPDGYGVAVAADMNMVVAERFNSCRLFTTYAEIEDSVGYYLVLQTPFREYRNKFATICAEFADPGTAGERRKALLRNPLAWWKEWKELVGNVNRDQRVYDIIAEMLVLEKKMKSDPSTEWTALISGSHDIECADESCEVKSTIVRYGRVVSIAGQHQLDHVKRLFLYFCKMEESGEGVSINDMKNRLIKVGYEPGKLEHVLQLKGFENGASIRDVKYKPLEQLKYEVDDDFPRIVPDSFKNNQIPKGIEHIQYTVNLTTLGEGEEW